VEHKVAASPFVAGAQIRSPFAVRRRSTVNGQRSTVSGQRPIFQRDRYQQVKEVRYATRISPGPLLDSAHSILGGVWVDLEALGGEAEVEV
jgi:hypothetical protein